MTGQYGSQNDGSKASNSRSSQGGGEGISQLLLIILIVFALIASVLMLFTNSTTWMKIAVLSALWAAFIGGVAVARLRKQVSEQKRQTEGLERLHKAELERELAAHREQELILEQNYLDSLQEKEQNILADIRAELMVLRENLSAMMGTDLDAERTALRAEAERILELERETRQASEARTAGSTSRNEAAQSASNQRSQSAPAGQGSQSAQRTQSTSGPLQTGSFGAVKWTVDGNGAGSSAAPSASRAQSVQNTQSAQNSRNTSSATSAIGNRGAGANQPKSAGFTTGSSSAASSTPSGYSSEETNVLPKVDEARPSTGAFYLGRDSSNSDYFVFGDQPEQARNAAQAAREEQARTSSTQSAPSSVWNSTSQGAAGSASGASSASHRAPRRETNPDTGSFAAFGSSSYSSSRPGSAQSSSAQSGSAHSGSAQSVSAHSGQGTQPTPQQPFTTAGSNSSYAFGAGNASESSTASASGHGRHEEPEETGGRRRRREDGQSNVTVASLLEQLKRNSSGQ